jgi:hypothetical protein
MQEDDFMRRITITFVDRGTGTDAKLAAGMLAGALAVQGHRPERSERCVTWEAAGEGPAQVLVLLSEDLLHEPVILSAVDSQTTVVLCSARPAEAVSIELGRPTAKLATVDAEGIASGEGTDLVVALLGGAARVVPEINLESLTQAVWHAYDRTFAYEARAAMRALDLGYALTQEWHTSL